MKKNTFIETPIKGYRRLSFPRAGMRSYALSPSGGLTFEYAMGEDEYVRNLDGGIGTIEIADGLKTYTVGDQPLQLLTFDPALFNFRFEDRTVTFLKCIGNGNFKTVLKLPLDAFGFFLIADYRRRVEVWFLCKQP